MLAWNRIVVNGLVTSLVLCAFVVVTMLVTYRQWLQDFPKFLRCLLPPKTAAEKRATILVAIPFFALAIGTPTLSLILAQAEVAVPYSFLEAWTHAWIVWKTFNLFVLLMIDCLRTSLINPAKPPIHGTEGSPAYSDYSFHLVGFAKGTAMGSPSRSFPPPSFWCSGSERNPGNLVARCKVVQIRYLPGNLRLEDFPASNAALRKIIQQRPQLLRSRRPAHPGWRYARRPE